MQLPHSISRRPYKRLDCCRMDHLALCTPNTSLHLLWLFFLYWQIFFLFFSPCGSFIDCTNIDHFGYMLSASRWYFEQRREFTSYDISPTSKIEYFLPRDFFFCRRLISLLNHVVPKKTCQIQKDLLLPK